MFKDNNKVTKRRQWRHSGLFIILRSKIPIFSQGQLYAASTFSGLKHQYFQKIFFIHSKNMTLY